MQCLKRCVIVRSIQHNRRPSVDVQHLGSARPLRVTDAENSGIDIEFMPDAIENIECRCRRSSVVDLVRTQKRRGYIHVGKTWVRWFYQQLGWCRRTSLARPLENEFLLVFAIDNSATR